MVKKMTPEARLKKIARIYERRYQKKSGRTKINITTHLYYNTLGAVYDLRRTKKADRVILKTLNNTLKRLAQIGELLDLPA